MRSSLAAGRNAKEARRSVRSVRRLKRVRGWPQRRNYIVVRYSVHMRRSITTRDYRALAELRYRIREFVHEGDAAARRCGLEPQHYQMLLAVRGMPASAEATIGSLAQRLALKHNSTVELIGRMERRGYVRRVHGRGDRRRVHVELRGRGQHLLERVARQRLTELRARGSALVAALDAVLRRRPRARRWARASQPFGRAAKRS